MSSASRLHRQPIFRVRTGCLTCRSRKKKCDETKPRCRGCERNQLTCRWPWSVRACSTVNPPPRSVRPAQPVQDYVHVRVSSLTGCNTDTTTVSGSALSASGPYGPLGSPETYLSLPSADSVPCNSPPASAAMPDADESGGRVNSQGYSTRLFRQIDAIPFPHILPDISTIPGCLDDIYADARDDEKGISSSLLLSQVADGIVSGNTREQIPLGLSILPGLGGTDSPDLLRHYLGVTTLSMSNGSIPWNPFLVQLIPLAFGSELVLQLILTQSAVHRAVRLLDSNDTVAYRYYDRSVQLFQREISNSASTRGREDALTLGIGALIMCFIEIARGDINGAAFNHLVAAHSLLLPYLSPNACVPKELREFLIEYYVYTAALALICIDARVSPQLLLCDGFESLAKDLVASSYVGSMCGCWLELILLIPRIFDFGRLVMAQDITEDGTTPTADDFALFANLHAHILRWSAPATVTTDVAIAGRIYQQAVLLYLYTALHPLQQPNSYDNGRNNGPGMYVETMQEAVTEALALLERLPPTARLNTSLCWPIAVVGSCVTDETQQEFLLDRLDRMFDVIGLGNIRQTAVLLRHFWASTSVVRVQGPTCTAADIGPWNICRVMYENQIWICFA